MRVPPRSVIALLGCVMLVSLVAEGQRRAAAQTPAADAALGAALATFGGVTQPDCTDRNPEARLCIEPRSSPDTIAAGIATFGVASPLGMGGFIAVFGAGADGGWRFWFSTQQTYALTFLPGAVRVCADGDGANVRAAPGFDAEVVGYLPDLFEATASAFVLTEPGAVEPLVAGAGWYRIGGPADGWVYSTLLQNALQPGCDLRNAQVRR